MLSGSQVGNRYWLCACGPSMVISIITQDSVFAFSSLTFVVTSFLLRLCSMFKLRGGGYTLPTFHGRPAVCLLVCHFCVGSSTNAPSGTDFVGWDGEAVGHTGRHCTGGRVSGQNNCALHPVQPASTHPVCCGLGQWQYPVLGHPHGTELRVQRAGSPGTACGHYI